MRAGGTDVSLRDVTIAQMVNGATEWGWLHAPEVRGRFWGFWKSHFVELSPASEEDGWLSLARRSQASCVVAVPHKMGGRWKSQNKKNVYLSPYSEEPLNSKVIKSFVPELRSRKCFWCFDIPMFYVYMLWTLYVRFTYPYLAMLHWKQMMENRWIIKVIYDGCKALVFDNFYIYRTRYLERNSSDTEIDFSPEDFSVWTYL